MALPMRSWLVDVVVYFLARQRRATAFQRGVRVLEVVLARDERFCLRKLLAYSGSPNWAARYLAGRGLPRFYPSPEAERGWVVNQLEERLRGLAADEDPRVREGVVVGLAELGRSRSSEGSPAPSAFPSLFRRWSQDPSEPLRRAILAATVSLVPGLDEEGLESLMDLWEGLLNDPSRTIRRDLMHHAVGSALIDRNPPFAFRYLCRWLSWGDPQVDRQISYLLLTSSLCERYPLEVCPILAGLAERYMEAKAQGSGTRDQKSSCQGSGTREEPESFADSRPLLTDPCFQVFADGRSLTTVSCFKGAPGETASVIRIRVALALRKQGLGVRDS